jgi:hypothetical protein
MFVFVSQQGEFSHDAFSRVHGVQNRITLRPVILGPETFRVVEFERAARIPGSCSVGDDNLKCVQTWKSSVLAWGAQIGGVDATNVLVPGDRLATNLLQLDGLYVRRGSEVNVLRKSGANQRENHKWQPHVCNYIKGCEKE